VSRMLSECIAAYNNVARGLEWFAPLSLLSFRLWVAIDFWNAGRVKLDDMNGTISLFENIYHVPLLPPVIAAYLGTGVELILPWFLGLGLGGRVTAVVLFVYNIVAVVSYPDLWPNGLWSDLLHGGFPDHKAWGLMLMAIVFFGPGKLSIDHALQRWLRPGIVRP
jgi:putative oxidoreductase